MTRHLHLYALLEAGPAAAEASNGAELSGIEDHAVEFLPLAGGTLMAAASRLDAPAPRVAEQLARHAEVVNRIFARTPLLPARFGTGGSDVAAIERLLGSRVPAMLATLRSSAGSVEVGLRIVLPDPVPDESAAVATASADDGRSYLHRRLQARRLEDGRRAALAGWIDGFEAPLRQWAIRSTASRTRDPRALSSTAFLGPRDGLAALREAVPSSTTHPSGARAVLGGPWPPWSFVDLEGASQYASTEAA